MLLTVNGVFPLYALFTTTDVPSGTARISIEPGSDGSEVPDPSLVPAVREGTDRPTAIVL